ncbi:TetR/AcrR family transcriptional regulator [Aidingimonas halophila]|uniref:Transcriptional regulator, TetR family n=1 Tax=Aidingimonas halophila TaxID=574349 RepID=A0A1H2SAM5_9GAMM|nr:TetR/AcrR family transcriptional regulator [Aidingimonas halophila]SDW28666.1 transcriptional regulator, TetR family [Aidingimonas halophila]
MNFNPEQALSAAMHAFWAQGYQSASTQALLTAMQLSRSSLYQTFGSKEALFIEALSRYRTTLLRNLEKRLDDAMSARRFLETLFHDTAADAGSERAAWGCLIFNSANELGHQNNLPSRHARQSVTAITDLFQHAVEQAQQEGDIDPEHNARSLALYLTMGMAGLRTLLKNGATAEEAHASVTLLFTSVFR